MKRPAVFLDRDGTMVEEVNYLSRIEDLRLFPFTRDAVRLLKDHDYLLFVITNQSGIARGLIEESSMHAIHNRIQSELSGAIDGFYFCPHLPGSDCSCRKPRTGLIDAAVSDLGVDLKRSWMVGDKSLDIEVGHNAGISTVMVLTGYGRSQSESLIQKPDFVASDLMEAATFITRKTDR